MICLKKREIVDWLRKYYGIEIENVRELNKILEEMGIIYKCGNGWETLQKGERFTYCNSVQVFNCDLWKSTLVDAVAKYLKEK